ncbi:MAG TPA: hypothetical protein VFC00_21030 [Micromonosporaceae bacterium]|nr:hypothetical protein [Micromonosporaceae bacterium]
MTAAGDLRTETPPSADWLAPELWPEADGAAGVATWHHQSRQLTAVAVWSERRPGLGEDAEPTFMYHDASRHGLLGVYDGLGGAGARHAGPAYDGRQLTHAFVASRLAYLTVQSWFADRVDHPEGTGSLRNRLAGARSPGRSRPKVVGTLPRAFPTTVALMEYRLADDGVDVTAYWAGDSRCYLMTPAVGLQQVSVDDTSVRDPLIADQPMTNLASATGDFTINEYPLSRIPLPCVLVCATDGFFGYVETPALFEYVLLDELRNSHGSGHWARRLASRVVSYTGGDASLVLLALGFGSFQRLRDSLSERHAELYEQHYAPLRGATTRDQLVERRRQSWERYRRPYMHYVDRYGTR